MKKSGDPLDRLFDAAAKAPRTTPEVAPFGMETRVLAGWRATPGGDDGALLVFWLRRAMMFACVLVLLSGIWNYQQATRREGDEFSFADSTIRIALNNE
ncbi:MAG: hypothetical protein JWR19_998 [Pedosphaera sp.]|nr:hypothetical protein [Pedosphaera sp.]